MRRAQDESASTAVQANSAYANAQMDMPTKIRTVTLGEERRDRLPLKLDADGGIKPATTTIPSRQKMKNAQPLHRPTS
jgi:hypothetical protein